MNPRINPYVSVVVPTYRRPDLLARCLAALLAQDYCPSACEVIVADDAADDATRHQVRSLAARAGNSGPVLRYVPVTCGHGPAAARNAGWRAAHGPIIAFTDDDCVPEPSWLRAGTAAFTRDVAGVAGRLRMPLPPAPTDYELDAAQLANATFVTANCFYRKDALQAVGGFDERFRLAWREDSDLHFNLLARGYKLVYAPGAVVAHPVRPAEWGVSLRQQRKSFYNALLYKKHPVLYRKFIQAAPPWHYYGILGALAVALGGLLARRSPLAVAGMLLWLALTGRFCLRRLDGTSHAPRHVAEMAVTSALIPPLSVFWRLRGALKFWVPFL